MKIASCMPYNKSFIDEAWSDKVAVTNTASLWTEAHVWEALVHLSSGEAEPHFSLARARDSKVSLLALRAIMNFDYVRLM